MPLLIGKLFGAAAAAAATTIISIEAIKPARRLSLYLALDLNPSLD
jgi:hypothetical protein